MLFAVLALPRLSIGTLQHDRAESLTHARKQLASCREKRMPNAQCVPACAMTPQFRLKRREGVKHSRNIHHLLQRIVVDSGKGWGLLAFIHGLVTSGNRCTAARLSSVVKCVYCRETAVRSCPTISRAKKSETPVALSIVTVEWRNE